MSQPRVVLFVAEGCGLCDEAREVLGSEGIAYEEASEPRYALRVPVVEIEGAIVAEGRISPMAVRRAFRKAFRSV